MASRAIEIGDVGAHVAAAVAKIRKRKGLEQRELAQLVTDAGRPMSASVLSKVEAGSRRIDVDDLVALARALGVSSPVQLLPESAGGVDAEPSLGGGPVGMVEAAVRDDIEVLGDLEGLEGAGPTLAQIAVRLAREMDYGGGEGGKALHSLAKELRAVLSELRSLVPEEPPDDDDLDDLAAPD